ncbi:MAG: beta-glucosidase [Planctomycetes bacterium]|nr:beta-glucosidase [Planctomycetota bacterium]
MAQWQFPDGFLWGTATASYQVEGAASEDGRGPSIWDTFCRTPGKVKHGHTGDVASDQFHRYAEDVKLMRDLGVGAYRFSLAWPRIFPQGTGAQNPKGFDYYHRLLDALLAAGIRPAVTLYHWDLPQPLEDAGGWPARDTAKHFADYAAACFVALGDKVDFWITLNEPWCSAVLGYELGIHAPGRTGRAAAHRAAHHLNLGHGLAVQAFRVGGGRGEIGTTLNLAATRPATRREEDVLAADRARDKGSRLFLDPLFGGNYPQRLLDAYPDAPLPIKEGDMEAIAQPLDFIGVNMYSESAVRHDPNHPEQFAHVPSPYPQTDMGWDITPLGIYRLLKWVDDEYGHPTVYVTENGCAMPDVLSDDGTRCHDPGRVDFLRRYIAACGEAVRDGVDLRGYFVWSLIDNFEWSFGYTKRFGIVYCDYGDCRRVPKDSFHFYREVIAGNEGFGPA